MILSEQHNESDDGSEIPRTTILGKEIIDHYALTTTTH